MTIEGAEVPINRYFHTHPEMVLGEWNRERQLYGDSGYSVRSNGNLAEQLEAAIQHLPAVEPDRRPGVQEQRTPARFERPPPQSHVTEGSFFLRDDRTICRLIDGQPNPAMHGRTVLRADGTKIGKRLAALIKLRDEARRVLQSQNEGWPESERQAARRSLNAIYDLFVFVYGPINKTTFAETCNGRSIRRMPNLVLFREDPDAMLVMSLEEYDEVSATAGKAAILREDVVGRKPEITAVRSAEEGLLVSLDHRGVVDLPYIASLYGRTEEEVIAELGDLIYQNPENRLWETADVYLSGNVRTKLAIAEAAGADYAAQCRGASRCAASRCSPGRH